jgi:sulfite exporter TauE/SafE
MEWLFTLSLGFFLGIKHSFEADHVIAVSTMVTEHKNPFRAALIGTFWGIGHTTTLFIAGIVILLLKITIPDKIALSLEFIVGCMLVGLGIYTLYKAKNMIHTHEHTHENEVHDHLHRQGLHRHHKSFLIGTIHGLAGSGALMVLVLATVQSTIEGLYYILIFGIGSIAGMTIMSMVIGLPFIYSTKKFPAIEQKLRITAGILSIFFGFFVMYTIGFTEGLFIK